MSEAQLQTAAAWVMGAVCVAAVILVVWQLVSDWLEDRREDKVEESYWAAERQRQAEQRERDRLEL